MEGVAFEESGNSVNEEVFHLAVPVVGVGGEAGVELILGEGATVEGSVGLVGFGADEGNSVDEVDLVTAHGIVDEGEGPHLDAQRHVLVPASLDEFVHFLDAGLQEGAGLGLLLGSGRGSEGHCGAPENTNEGPELHDHTTLKRTTQQRCPPATGAKLRLRPETTFGPLNNLNCFTSAAR